MPCKKLFSVCLFCNNYYEEFQLLSLKINHFTPFRRKKCAEFRKKDSVGLRGVCSRQGNVATQADVLFINVH